ncbi:putative signal peptide protein [Puccinia sorghi]|uniref:Putative signal peptide protein n=1 Tax=Puccinia sorghi TaxID=27349 RepID=A0A0L6VQB8_9BASI|nr:putative signal peptide protein [Puccinia sorghi]
MAALISAPIVQLTLLVVVVPHWNNPFEQQRSLYMMICDTPRSRAYLMFKIVEELLAQHVYILARSLLCNTHKVFSYHFSQKHSICSLCLISIYWILYETTNTKLCQKMPLTRSGSKKPSDNFGRTIADNLALSKFLANLNSYVSYITPHLKSDGSNMSQWIDSVNDLAHLLFDIKTFSEMRITLIGSMNPWITRFCIS